MVRTLLTLLFLAAPAFAMQSAADWCQQGNQVVVTGGVNSTTKVQRSYPSCTVTVYDAGTVNLSVLYSDDGITPKANPFAANTNGYWYFYAANGTYTVQLSGGGLGSPITLATILLDDPGIANVSANRVFAGPATGSPAQPAFRLLVTADLPSVTLSGDVTGPIASTVVAKINGTTVPATPSTHQIPVVTASNTITWKSVSDCHSSGQALQFTQSSDAFSCATGALDFSAITAGTNTAALTVGSGGVLTYSGTGIIDARKILGTTLTGLTGVIKMTSGIPSVATAGSDYVSPTVATTWTAGIKQTMSQSATTAGFNLGALASNPSTPAQGDVWYNNGAVLFRDSAATRTFATLDGSQTLTNKTLTSPTITGAMIAPSTTITGATIASSVSVDSALYTTTTNCADSAGAAACGAAPAGAFVIDAGNTTVVVSTTAVTANSEIFLAMDSSLGTRLSVTCNTNIATAAFPSVSARTAATSFTVTISGTVGTNPLCMTYHIVN